MNFYDTTQFPAISWEARAILTGFVSRFSFETCAGKERSYVLKGMDAKCEQDFKAKFEAATELCNKGYCDVIGSSMEFIVRLTDKGAKLGLHLAS